MKIGGGNEKDIISGIHADAAGNLYVTGSFEKTMLLDKILLESSGKKDVFLARYNPDGNVQWLKKGGSATGDDISTAIEIDKLNNIYITGYYSGIASFGEIKLKSNGSDDIFLVKYNSKGDILWAKSSGGQGNEHAGALIMDGLGSVYIAGEYDSQVPFGEKNETNSINRDVFVQRFRENGELKGTYQITGAGFKKVNSLAFDKQGNLYLLGYFTQQASFGNIRLDSQGKKGSGFISKMKHF